MKKILINIIFMSLLLFPLTVFAKGDITTSPDSLTIEVGSSKTFKISAYNTIGDVTISSSDTSVASVDKNTWETGMTDENKTVEGTITVKGEKVGTTAITITIDGATFDEEDLTGQTRSVSVNVIDKSTPNPTPTPDNTEKNKITIKYTDTNGNIISQDTIDYVETGKHYNLNCPDNLNYNNTNYILDAISNKLEGKINSDVTTTCKYTAVSKKTGDNLIIAISVIAICMLVFIIYKLRKKNNN